MKNVEPLPAGTERESWTSKHESNAAVSSLVVVTTGHLGYRSKTTVGHLGFYQLYLQRGASESLYSGNHSVNE